MSKQHIAPPIGAIPEGGVQEAQGASEQEKQALKSVRVPRQEDFEQPHPLYCVWEITLACDLGCRHCGSRAGDARPTELSTEECLDVVRQLHELGIREVTLIGGEAYLREDWDIIAREVTDRGMVCGMTTGARALTQERVDRAVKAGLQTISISIDGLEKTHDALRGAKGSWKDAIAAAKRVADSPIRLTTNTQINRLSMPELPALAELLIQIKSKAWQMQITAAMGNAADRPFLLLQPYDLLELFPLLVWIKQTKLIPNGIMMFPGNNIGYFGPYEHLLRLGGEHGAHWAGCGAGKWTLGLEADGKIKGCPSLQSDTYTGGNFKEDTLADVVANRRELRMFRERIKDDLWGFCHSCYYADICKAGCSWTSHSLLGRPGNNPYCIHRALTLEKAGKRERVEKIAKAPGVPFDNGLFKIVQEPMPLAKEEEEPSVLGVPLSRVMELPPDFESLWEKKEIIQRLTKDK